MRFIDFLYFYLNEKERFIYSANLLYENGFKTDIYQFAKKN